MIDRENRNALVAAFDDYLSGIIGSFEFDERLHALNTADETVRAITRLAWFHYDDLIDHPVKLSRQEWNYFQRLRLIAQSDSEITIRRVWNWSSVLSLALLEIVGLLLAAAIFGIGWQLAAINFAMGVLFVSVAMSAARQSEAALIPRTEMFPFESFSTMRTVYESVPSFQKMTFPRTMDPKPLRSNITFRIMMLPWLFLWPLLVLLQLLGIRRSSYSVLPAQSV